MKTIYIPIETKVREFDGKLWLSLNLAKEGYRVVIGEKSRKFAVDKLQPDLHIEVGATYSNSYYNSLIDISEAGCRIGLLDTEGGVFPSEDYYFENAISEEILETIDVVFSWGEITANVMSERTFYPEEQIYITGNPRFDLLNSELRDIYLQPAADIAKRLGRIVLVNTNFTSANSFDERKRKQILEKRGRLQDTNKVQHQQELLNRFLDAIDSLSETNPEHTVVIRPHPAENHDFYREQFADNPSVVVEHSGDVRAWIYAADCVIHNSCTTGIEAAMLSTPVIAYEPEIEVASYQRPHLPNTVSKSVHSLDELLNQVEEYTSQSDPYEMSPEQISELEKYFANVKEPAAPKIVDAISELDLDGDKTAPDLSLKRRTELWMKDQPIAPLIKRLHKVAGRKSEYQKQKFPGLTITEVRSRIRDFEEQVGPMDLEVSQINRYDDIYLIQK